MLSSCGPRSNRYSPAAARPPVFVFAIVLLAAVVPLVLPGRPEAANDKPARAPTAVDDPAAVRRVFPGILLPGRSALIKSKHHEVVERVAVTIGDAVKEGQLLIQLVSAEERVSRDRAAALLENARAHRDRVRQLHEKGNISAEALEDAERDFHLAKAELDMCTIWLEELSIRAPFNGIVAERYVDPGTSVEEGDPLVRVTATHPLRMEALLPESVLPLFSGPATVELRPSHPDTTLRLSVELKAVVVDPASGTFPLQIEVQNPDGHLVPGVSCRLTISSAVNDPP